MSKLNRKELDLVDDFITDVYAYCDYIKIDFLEELKKLSSSIFVSCYPDELEGKYEVSD